jgi:hypothetical protein
MIGSRPVVGSSKKMISGVRRDGPRQPHALLHAAGKLRRVERRPVRVPSPTCAKLVDGDGARLRLASVAPLHQPEGDVAPDAQAVEQRRPLEQHAEALRDMSSRALPVRPVPSPRPPRGSSPGPAVMMPRMHFSITDFPVPDPPMITSEWPLGTLRLTPFSTCFGPKLL